jgi:hypothetical protein
MNDEYEPEHDWLARRNQAQNGLTKQQAVSSVIGKTNIACFIWELNADGRIAIVQNGQQFNILIACDTFNTLTEAVNRFTEIVKQFEKQQKDMT